MTAARKRGPAPKDRGALLTAAQAGARLCVKPREVGRFIRERGLPGIHLGRKLGWRVFEADLAAWLERLRGNGTRNGGTK